MKKNNKTLRKSKRSTRVPTRFEYGLISSKCSDSRLHFNTIQTRLKCKRSNSAPNFNFLNNNFLKSKASQITIFVIIGIILVVAIALIFFFKDKFIPAKDISQDVRQTMEKCIKDSANSAVKEIISHGGYLNETIKQKRYIVYDKTEVAFLCYTSNYEELCTNLEPMLLQNIESEIKKDITPKIENCFSTLETNLKKAYSYNAEATSIDVKIVPKQADIIVNKKITITKNEQTEIFEDFSQSIKSPMYDFIILSNEIINGELQCDCSRESCNADIIGLNGKNHEFELTKPVYSGNSEEVYVIKEISSGDKFQFALRNCVRRVPGV